MKRLSLLTLVLLLCGFGQVKAQAAGKTKKTVFIIVDGIPADVIEKVATPHLDQIARVGGYTRASMGGEKGGYSETPTISAVGYNSLLTGTWANKHNVWSNDIKDPNYHYWTIFRFLKEQYPQKKTAIFSTWLDNRTKLVGEGLPETGKLAIDYHFDGFELDTVQFPHDPNSDYIRRIDAQVASEAARYIRQQGPDLSWVYLQYTDDMGHHHGDSQAMYEAVALADRQVGQLWKAIQYRQQNKAEDWLIIVTTDHGRDASTGKGHGGQSDRERTIWITTNADSLNQQFHKEQPAMVDILPGIARFMNIKIPKEQARELDGVPFIGPVSLTDPKVKYHHKTLEIRWKALEKEGKVKVWLSKTNNFKQQGEADSYSLQAEVPLQKEQCVIDLSPPAADFYKVVLEGPHNTLNQWVMVEK